MVGYNLVSPTAHPVKKDHRGAFIQEKTKDFIKHYVIAKALPGCEAPPCSHGSRHSG